MDQPTGVEGSTSKILRVIDSQRLSDCHPVVLLDGCRLHSTRTTQYAWRCSSHRLCSAIHSLTKIISASVRYVLADKKTYCCSLVCVLLIGEQSRSRSRDYDDEGGSASDERPLPSSEVKPFFAAFLQSSIPDEVVADLRY